jgi:hypothetical protein
MNCEFYTAFFSPVNKQLLSGLSGSMIKRPLPCARNTFDKGGLVSDWLRVG